jgi:hypothetical protein
MAEVVRACGMHPGSGGDRDAVPRELLPRRSVVRGYSASGSGWRATVAIGLSLRDAFDAISREAPRGGWRLTGTENDGYDAEIYLARGGARTVVRLFPARYCADATSAVLTTVRA